MKSPRPEPPHLLDAFLAMTPLQRAAAVYWLQHGFWPADLPERLLPRLDAWAFRAETSGPSTMAMLRVEAGLSPADPPQSIDLDSDLDTEPC